MNLLTIDESNYRPRCPACRGRHDNVTLCGEAASDAEVSLAAQWHLDAALAGPDQQSRVDRLQKAGETIEMMRPGPVRTAAAAEWVAASRRIIRTPVLVAG